MNGAYDIGLVILSIGVAILASYVALDLAARVAASRGSKAALYWLNGGAIAMGTGIWSMHFIGMLAFRLPIPMSYDIPITLLSLLIAVIVSGFALRTVSQDGLNVRRLLGAGLYMGIGIAAMHYTGMAAMQMEPPISYDPLLFVLSILIAIIASIVALWIAFQLRSETIVSAFWKKAGSALVMGAAISGMHYTGMAAAVFAPNSFCVVDPQNINNVWLAGAIGGFTFMFLATTLLISVFDARLADHSAKQAETLRKANIDLAIRTTQLTKANEVMRQEGLERMQAEIALRQSEERLRAAFDQSTVGIAHTALGGRILQVNQKLCEILGYSGAELQMRTLMDVTHPDDPATSSDSRRQLLASMAQSDLPTREKRYIRKDGSAIWAMNSVSLVRKPSGEPDYFVTMVQDVSASKATEEFFRATFEQAAVGMAMRDVDPHKPRLLRVNQKLCDILGYTREELLQLTSVDLTLPEERDLAVEYNEQLVRGEMTSYSREKRYVRKDGQVIWANLSLSTVRGPDGRPTHIISVIQDISERKQAEERLAYLAQYDSLTGLPNRNLFRDRLTLAMARAKRNEQMVAVMFLGLDHFKVINDTLGHATGDEVLQAAAALLKDALRDVDTVARFGGDQFTVILEDIAQVDQVTTVAEKIKQAFSAPIVIGEQEVFVTVSAGITIYPLSGDEIDAVLQMADAAMYHAKKMGRNTYEYYAPELNAQAGERLKMEALLRRALERREFALHYQPKVETATGKIVGVEALIRWNSRELGFIPPVQFIPLAEETGLIEPIGAWVIKTACAQNKAWQDQGFPPLLMSVNLSPRQLRQKNLVEMIAAMLDESGLAPHLLELEITESLIMENIQENIRTLKSIRGLGVNLAIDDFGTGYSSLGYLAKLPVQTLKIDRSFIAKMQDDADAMTLVATILTLARSLGLKVVAEGVETEEQAKVLRLLRCDQIQGYLISKPVPSAELSAFLNQTLQSVTDPGTPTNRAGAADPPPSGVE